MVKQTDEGFLIICTRVREEDGKPCGARVTLRPHVKVVCPGCGAVHPPYLGEQQGEVKNK